MNTKKQWFSSAKDKTDDKFITYISKSYTDFMY